MTCIVGVVQDGEVWLGADGRCTFDYYYTPIAQPKIARVGPMLIGAAGDARIAQVLFSGKEIPAMDGYAPLDYLCGPFAQWGRERLKEQEAMLTDSGNTPNTKSHWVIALAGQLFLIDGRFAVFESKRGFEAAGSGLEVALGYLIATPDKSVRPRIEGALTAAAEVILSVGPPFHIEKL